MERKWIKNTIPPVGKMVEIKMTDGKVHKDVYVKTASMQKENKRMTGELMINEKAILYTLKERMIETGRCEPTDRINYVEHTTDNGSDYLRLGITLTHKRCVKPYVYWNLCIRISDNIIHWDTSTFYYL